MKVKSRPEDFRVEEIARVECGGGPFALYHLAKRSLGTPEAIEAICRRWDVPTNAVGFGGLKDRHAETRQYISIQNGPRRGLKQTNVELDYLGQTTRPFESADIVANRFEIVLRDLRADEVDCITEELPRVLSDGVPNYFDDQRFGSVGVSGDFVARPWCLGDYDRALWLALAEANVHDPPQVREEKQALRDRWQDWGGCRQAARRGVSRRAFDWLCRRPADVRGAFVSIPQPERRMYLGAFQSFLWNRILGARLRELFAPADLFDLELGGAKLPFYRGGVSESLRESPATPLPLPTSREKLDGHPLQSLYEQVAGEFGLECRQLRVKYPRDSFFSRGDRATVFFPWELAWEAADDELAAGSRRRKLVLRFDLDRGSYATVLIKRLGESG